MAFFTKAFRISVIAVYLLLGTGFSGQISQDFGTYKARDIRDTGTWINGGPLSLKSLKGKVVVVDFWAFDCEPCI